MGSRTKKDNRSQSKQAINSCSSRRPFAPCASWGSWLLAVGVLASPRLMCIFVIICLLLWPKGTITPREKPAALATRAHDSSSNHTDDYFKKADQDYVRHRRFLATPVGSVRGFAGAQPRAGQKKCERGRESAAPGKSKQAPADEGYRRLRRVFGRERSKQPARQGGRLFDSFCRLHPADVTDRGANGRERMTWFASEEK